MTNMRVGIIGLGAIANLHARAYKNIGYPITVCHTRNVEAGRLFAAEHGAAFVETYEEVCRHPDVDFVDVCTFPDFRLQPLEICAAHGKHIQVQKPMSITLDVARRMIETARAAGIQLGVVSQHRFDVASDFMLRALEEGRLGRLLQADAYVKWYRSDEYYSRPVKGSWLDGGRRRPHQPGDSPGRHPALARRAGHGGVRRLEYRCRSQDRVGGHGQCGAPIWQRRRGGDPGVDGVLARIPGADRIPRHQRDGGDYRRQADDVGRARR